MAASSVQPGVDTGRGLFSTNTTFRPHDVVTEYTGSVITRGQAEQENRENDLRAGHFLGLGREFVLAGDTEPKRGKGGAQFAQSAPPGVCNAAMTLQVCLRDGASVRLQVRPRRPLPVARARVPAGDARDPRGHGDHLELPVQGVRLQLPRWSSGWRRRTVAGQPTRTATESTLYSIPLQNIDVH